MNSFRSIQLSTEETEALRGRLLKMESVTPVLSDPRFCALIASLGIRQEVGTINDEFARFIYDDSTKTIIPRECLRAEIIEYHGFTGVRIWAEGYDRLDLKLKGIRELLHPTFSFNPDGTVKQCVIFPESVAKIAKLQGAELVLVSEWAINTIFGGFDRSKLFYETNAWELVHNDALRYSGLLESRQIAFLGTHDLTAHISGMSRLALDELQTLGAEALQRFHRYFGFMKKPSVYSLVLPYAAGVLLDDLAQPRNYGSPGRRFVFEKVMAALDRRMIDPAEPRLLTRFPDSYEKLIQLARDPDFGVIQSKAHSLCQSLIRELKQFSLKVGNNDSKYALSIALKS